jgi:hypothetical protein
MFQAPFGRREHKGNNMAKGGVTQPWPEERVARLVELWNSGLSSVEVAQRLELTRMAVESKLAKLRRAGRPLVRRHGMRRVAPARAMRNCLYCGHAFASEHVGNRLCPTCLAEGPFTSAMV